MIIINVYIKIVYFSLYKFKEITIKKLSFLFINMWFDFMRFLSVLSLIIRVILLTNLKNISVNT